MRACMLSSRGKPARLFLPCRQPLRGFVTRQAQSPLHSEYRHSRKEQLRRDEKPVFTYQRWVHHRSTSRYSRHMLGLVSSSTLTALFKPITLLTLQAALAGCLESLNTAHHFFPSFNFHVSHTPFELTSFALSLLLVFRTDSSYARYDEAIKTWNSVHTGCTSIIRYGTSWVDDAFYSSLFSRWATAYSRSLKALVTEGNDYEAELKSILQPHELSRVLADASPPHYILQVLTSLLHQAQLSRGKDSILMDILHDLTKAVDVFGRILKHPIPLPYTRHTSRFMIIWLGILPFALWEDCGWAVVPITSVVSFLLLGIDEIAVQIEEPFGLMQLEEFCRSIEREAVAAAARQGDVARMIEVHMASALPSRKVTEPSVTGLLANNVLSVGDLQISRGRMVARKQ